MNSRTHDSLWDHLHPQHANGSSNFALCRGEFQNSYRVRRSKPSLEFDFLALKTVKLYFTVTKPVTILFNKLTTLLDK